MCSRSERLPGSGRRPAGLGRWTRGDRRRRGAIFQRLIDGAWPALGLAGGTKRDRRGLLARRRSLDRGPGRGSRLRRNRPQRTLGGGNRQLADDQGGAADLDRVPDRERLGARDPQAVDERSVSRAEVLDRAEAAAVEADPGVRAGDLVVVGQPSGTVGVAADQQFVVEQDRHPDRPSGHNFEARHRLAHARRVPRARRPQGGPACLQHSAAIGRLPGAMARLRVVSGPAAGRTVDVDEEIVIGREDSDLDIDDLELSHRHAVVRRFANRLQVEDLGSTNGTFVDGNRIAEPTLLGGGAEIKIGTTVMVVEGVLPVGSAESGRELDDAQPRNVTRVSAAVGANPPAAAPAPPSPAAPVTGEPPAQPLAPFHPPSQRRQKGLASRSWLPVALSFGTVIIVAIALVIYFSQHT